MACLLVFYSTIFCLLSFLLFLPFLHELRYPTNINYMLYTFSSSLIKFNPALLAFNFKQQKLNYNALKVS